MTETAVATLAQPTPSRPSGRVGRAMARMARVDVWTAALLRLARGLEGGRLVVTAPDGRGEALGDPDSPLSADLALHAPAAARRLLLGGPVAFGEAYVDGLWSSSDLVALMELAARNAQRVTAAAEGVAPLRWLNRLRHRLRANTKAGSRRNIAFHYDLGNGFYRLWLDAGMQYSSALYAHHGQSLEDAQAAKLARAAALLDVAPGMEVLEVGCGWGAMAEHLTERCGARVTGLTLSREQLAYAKDRLGGRADLRLQDYRDVGGTFDRIVSIEMIEAVGEAHWPRYFATLRDRLKPGGRAVVQAITIAEPLFDHYRREPDFIQRHVFPGGMLPTPRRIGEEAARAGLIPLSAETFGDSYARTLADWRARFHAAWPEAARQGFDDRFRRLWDYYLAYCEGGFRAGTIDVGFYSFTRP